MSLLEARKDRIMAKTHARFGMMVAIGEIQKHLGPDMRISATADLYDERILSGKNFEDDNYYDSSDDVVETEAVQSIDLNGNGEVDTIPLGQRFWTGVWKNPSRRKNSGVRYGRHLPVNSESAKGITNKVAYDSEFDPHPAIEQAWLVSGNEGFQKKLMMGNNPYSLDEYVEVPDGNLWDDSGLDNGRSFVNGGVYGNEPNPWLDFEKALESNLYEDLTFWKILSPKKSKAMSISTQLMINSGTNGHMF